MISVEAGCAISEEEVHDEVVAKLKELGFKDKNISGDGGYDCLYIDANQEFNKNSKVAKLFGDDYDDEKGVDIEVPFTFTINLRKEEDE